VRRSPGGRMLPMDCSPFAKALKPLVSKSYVSAANDLKGGSV